MNNFYLLGDAFCANHRDDFNLGIITLNSIIVSEYREAEDRLLRHSDLLSHVNSLGCIGQFVNEIPHVGLFWKIFSYFKESQVDLSDESIYDTTFPIDCNGYLGIDFSSCKVSSERQIICKTTYNTFKNNCIQKQVASNIHEFWKVREQYFKNLIFCDPIYDYLSQFSVNDLRFQTIKEKLVRLNEYAGKWTSGIFPHYEMGIQVSPDTPTRLKKSSIVRNYLCPDGTIKEFSWHIKLSPGIDYRIYYYPDPIIHKIIIGVIGTKSELGF